jgi:hypothetical protein
MDFIRFYLQEYKSDNLQEFKGLKVNSIITKYNVFEMCYCEGLDALIERNSSNNFEENDFMYLSLDELKDINNEIIECITNNVYYFDTYNYGEEVEQLNIYLFELASGVQSLIKVLEANKNLNVYYSLD